MRRSFVARQDQMICNTGFEPCPLPATKARYPGQARTVMPPLPRLPGVPKPGAGLPKNAFCPLDSRTGGTGS